MSDCVFCKIVAGEIPAEVVDETETTFAFRDASPAAPTHVLVVPRTHYRNAAELAVSEPDTLAQLVRIAHEIAEAEGIADGYRLVFNTGARAQQSVFHAHVHVLGGRELSWPPG
ncbi:MAG: histidine triad nucleotide-binding protein [Actinomycetota bacterium]|nr:histidine triad nucleotide-binding protein [Actinomycetota bacterium]MDQ6934002.1 histidine triad nucleotide-binding protein [Actinomycetota bacterium]